MVKDMAKIFLLALVRTKRSSSTKNEGCSSYDRDASPPEQRRKKERKKERKKKCKMALWPISVYKFPYGSGLQKGIASHKNA